MGPLLTAMVEAARAAGPGPAQDFSRQRGLVILPIRRLTAPENLHHPAPAENNVLVRTLVA